MGPAAFCWYYQYFSDVVFILKMGPKIDKKKDTKIKNYVIARYRVLCLESGVDSLTGDKDFPKTDYFQRII